MSIDLAELAAAQRRLSGWLDRVQGKAPSLDKLAAN